MHFFQAYVLAVFKVTNRDNMRSASSIISGILDTKISPHTEYCSKGGICGKNMMSVQEDKSRLIIRLLSILTQRKKTTRIAFG